MKKEDLFAAIGGVEDEILARCEYESEKRMTVGKIVLIAAMLAALAISAVAVATTHLKSRDIQDAQLTPFVFGLNDNLIGYEIELICELEADVPYKMKVNYLPRVPEDWKYYRGLDARTENGWWQYELQFKDPDWAVGKEKWQFGGWVTYGQRTAWHVANTEDASVDVLFDIPPGVVVSGESRRMGDYAVFVVQISAYEEKLSYYEYMPCGETRVYWCDGEIIYMLACPAWMEEDQILELMDSLYPVEDPFKR